MITRRASLFGLLAFSVVTFQASGFGLSCTPFLFYEGDSPRNPVIVLDMRGKWFVSDWNKTEELKNSHSPILSCITQWLSDHRHEDIFTSTVDSHCIGEGALAMREIYDNDPAIKACREPIECHPGDACV